ncbi:MAG: 5-formyltetrahydrofolate cyclo-ligase, partial [Phycisphaerae bacterium]|nr:5-formyltetrahydrofolate cyclo-ligase [Phycisphaerae bacterium]
MKKNLRKQIKQTLAAMSPETAAAKSAAAAEKLSAMEEFAAAKVIMLYLAIPGEVDTAPIAQTAWAAGKQVVAPRPCPDTRHMKPVLCHPADADLFHPALGLRSPAGMHVVPIDQIDLLIVPALAFDRNCNRLGRGGGFYDRFLARPELRAITVGLAFAEQILPELPIHPNDKPVDRIVTDN